MTSQSIATITYRGTTFTGQGAIRDEALADLSSSIQAVTLPMNAEEYVRRGVQMPGMTCQEWADQFTALGGTRCRISPNWDEPVGADMLVNVVGTPEAIAFVRQSIAGEREAA